MFKLNKIWHYNTRDPLLGLTLELMPKKSKRGIITHSKNGKIIILTLDGALLQISELAEKSSIWKIKMSDVNNDGRGELVICGMDGLLRTFQLRTPLSLTSLWIHRFNSSISGFLTPEDGLAGRICAWSLDKTLRILNASNGALIWGQVFEDGVSDATLYVNRIDPAKVVACGNDGTIRVFSAANGELLWFKRFNDKLRVVSVFKSDLGDLIACGGDEKVLNFINLSSQTLIKSIDYDEIVWKLLPIDLNGTSLLLISTYSFDFLFESEDVQKMQFQSNCYCMDARLEQVWEIKSINVEVIAPFKQDDKQFIALGTTTGVLLIIDLTDGSILNKVETNSCINGIVFDTESKLIITCHDSGEINAYFIEDG